MLKIKVNEDVAYIERGDTDPETTLAELMVACEGVLKDISNKSRIDYTELVKGFATVIRDGNTSVMQ